MSVFWLGTVPVLVGVGFGATRVLGRSLGRWPVAAALTVLALGLLTISGRIQPMQPGTAGAVHASH
jgi:hypothetical protein